MSQFDKASFEADIFALIYPHIRAGLGMAKDAHTKAEAIARKTAHDVDSVLNGHELPDLHTLKEYHNRYGHPEEHE